MIKFSTGLKNAVLDTGSLKASIADGLINIYSGPVPASADAAIDVSSDLLVTISDNAGAGGLDLEAAAVDGVISKAAAQTWSGTIGTSGTATFYRFVEDNTGDTGQSSATLKRIQGTVGVVGADLNLSSTSLTATETQAINAYFVGISN